MNNYTEHEKLKSLKGHNNTIGEFLEWLEYNGYILARHFEKRYECEECGDIEDGMFYRTTKFDDPAMYRCIECDNMVSSSPEGLFPSYAKKDDLIAGFFKINKDKLEKEKDEMLRVMRDGPGTT